MKRIGLLLIVLCLLCELSCRKNNNPGLSGNGIDYSNQSVGASAHDLLSPEKYTFLKIEIQYMPGFQPDAGSVSNLSSFLNGIVNKPGGIQITEKQIPASGNTSLSLTQVEAIEKQYRTVYTNNAQSGVYFLFTDGNYTDNSVLGVSYRNTSVCLFGKTIHDNSGAIGQTSRATLESAVMEHECGHILGLVNTGSPMQVPHEDPSHARHCNNQNCLMYYAMETTDMLGFLSGGTIPALDANCRADLKANGGK